MIKFKLNRRNVLIAASFSTVLATANHAIAQSPDREKMIARADTNGDGNISWEEVIKLRTEAFNRLDRNKDGVVNQDDSPVRPFAARFNEAFETLQSDFDSDRDGEITKEEMLTAPAPIFEKGDLNDDDLLSAEELRTLQSLCAPL